MIPKLPVFILGAQRSGTTLLRLLLNAHSQIAIPEEARFLMPLLTHANIERGLDRAAIQRLCAYLKASDEFALWNYDREPFLAELAERNRIEVAEFLHLLYASYASAEGKAHWADKSLFFRRIDILHRLFPSATFIHLIRDGRDVFDSWRKIDSGKDCAPAVALDWRLKTGMIETAFARLDRERHLTVRYEDLLQNPGLVVRSICEFLGIDFEEHMLDFHRVSNQYVGGHHSTLIFKPIDAANQAKWRRNLTRREKQAFDVVAGTRLETYRYGLSGETCTVLDRAAVFSELVHGSYRRAIDVVVDAMERRRALRNGTATEGIKVGERPAVVRSECKDALGESSRSGAP